MPKEINFYQVMALEHRLQEYCKGLVPLFLMTSVYNKSPNIHRKGKNSAYKNIIISDLKICYIFV